MNPINTNICARTNLALKLNYISPPLFQAITQLVEIGRPKPSSPVEIGQDWSSSATQKSPPICTNLHQSTPIYTEIAFPPHAGLLPFQLRWLHDYSILRIWEKSRQLGATNTDALDSVLKASAAEGDEPSDGPSLPLCSQFLESAERSTSNFQLRTLNLQLRT
jgi:hypothetical protein